MNLFDLRNKGYYGLDMKQVKWIGLKAGSLIIYYIDGTMVQYDKNKILQKKTITNMEGTE